jgi:MYXO-CTERM domain-containing protein
MQMFARAVLFSALVFGSGRAYAQSGDAGAPVPPLPDGGESEDATIDGGVGCGSVTEQGSCDPGGTILTYCNTTTNMVEVIDCAADVPTSRCIELNATYGSDCAEAPGSACLAQDENGEFYPLFCYGTMPGCLESEDEYVCTENLGTCTMDQIGTCMGQRLYAECSEGQPYLIDCASYGGDCSGAACRGIDIGKYCDEILFFCETDDRCVLNACVPTPAPDSGVPDPAEDAGVGPGRMDAGAGGDGGGSDGEDSEGCGCTSSNTQAGAAGSALLLLLGLGIRRRRSS